VIGGDGTHRGANKIAEKCIQDHLEISVVCIPKTIDNDIDIIDHSFGFHTSVEAAQQAILSAKTEAKCNMPNGIGIVRLMGRNAGFIAAHATLGSGDVDLCLIPEIEAPKEFDEWSPEVKEQFKDNRLNSYCDFLKQRIRDQKHAVIVVAEGAMEKHFESTGKTDAGGNKIIPRIEDYLKEKITTYFSKNVEPDLKEVTIKYIDPSYMIRSVPANANDSLYCMMLGQNAVHGAMAGFTAFSVGLVNTKMVYIPIFKIVEKSPRQMAANGRTWERVLALTGQTQHFTGKGSRAGEESHNIGGGGV
jgi:6-phosphofructokinase 1